MGSNHHNLDISTMHNLAKAISLFTAA